MENIKPIIEQKKIGYFKCPFCKDQSCYEYFDKETRFSKWHCTSCQSFGNMRDLNALTAQRKAELDYESENTPNRP